MTAESLAFLALPVVAGVVALIAIGFGGFLFPATRVATAARQGKSRATYKPMANVDEKLAERVAKAMSIVPEGTVIGQLSSPAGSTYTGGQDMEIWTVGPGKHLHFQHVEARHERRGARPFRGSIKKKSK